MPKRIISTALVVAAMAMMGTPDQLAAQQGGQGRPPAAVTVVTLEPQTTTLTSTLPGRVAASAMAEVRPQVSGIITQKFFKEGSSVAEGDALYQIDPASYDATLAQADASVAQAQAQLNAALKSAARVDELQSRNVASAQAKDDADAARASAEANLQAAQAQRAAAQIEKDRTTIHARLSGVIGLSQTSQGALVTASQALPLAVIRNIDPVYVNVTQSAADLLDWRRGQATAQLENFDPTVTLTLADGSTFDQTGSLTAAEPSVDEQTGVVVLRMEFANPDKLLLPGMYVQVELPTRTLNDVFLVPQEAVTRDQRGEAIVLVVDKDNVVHSKVVNVLTDQGADWIVDAGLQAGDRVIVAGLQKTAAGATVAPEERARAEAPVGDMTSAAAD
ncbi:membrane fusion protein (multidrug efflux system) [Primorskyibacter sedentarius]|uniref:Membrane fusion protein (Multidrug efflux system) n=1 Tax=Primorskyibacter sedentarius TaxID=745311 RepID=A0A4R3J535_9RHOB|nr:membrane fusion protein (multidrug efflux system) [Primorskyibacter sedentarius]